MVCVGEAKPRQRKMERWGSLVGLGSLPANAADAVGVGTQRSLLGNKKHYQSLQLIVIFIKKPGCPADVRVRARVYFSAALCCLSILPRLSRADKTEETMSAAGWGVKRLLFRCHLFIQMSLFFSRERMSHVHYKSIRRPVGMNTQRHTCGEMREIFFSHRMWFRHARLDSCQGTGAEMYRLREHLVVLSVVDF